MTTSSRPPYNRHAGTTERSDIDALIGGVADGSESDPFPVIGIDHVAWSAERGCLLELSRNGSTPLTLADGSTRSFLADGDEVSITATAPGPAGSTVGPGEVRGRIHALVNG